MDRSENKRRCGWILIEKKEMCVSRRKMAVYISNDILPTYWLRFFDLQPITAWSETCQPIYTHLACVGKQESIQTVMGTKQAEADKC